MNLQRILKAATKTALRKCGFELVRVGAQEKGRPALDLAEFKAARRSIVAKHDLQTPETITHLNAKYREPVFGEKRVWDLFERLAFCVDPTDTRLLNTSQYVHVLQILEAMENDRLKKPFWYLCAILHDLGKLLLLTSEKPENIVCMNSPVGESGVGSGLSSVFMQWNHDEFAYLRLKDYIPKELAWLIRFHSIDLKKSEPYMNERDRAYRDEYLARFRKYDMGSKSPCYHPQLDMDKYRTMVEEAFPDPIPF